MKLNGRQIATRTSAAIAGAATLLPAPAHAAIGFFQIPEDPRHANLNDIVTILVKLIQFGLMFAAAVAVIFIVLSGYQYIFSAGNPEKLEKAKQGLTWSITGFILTISSFAIVLLLQGILQAKHRVNEAPGIEGVLQGAPRDAQTIIPALADAFLVFGGATAVLFLILNGYRYASSQGDRDQVQAAQRGILYSVIGLAVVFAAYAIIVTVTKAIR